MSAASPRQLRNALVEMTLRLASSERKAAYADADGHVEQYERQKRAARRQFAAVQRLADALASIAGGAR